jgi:protein-S-isoprenylcysteine O-methyltransferase Ste14
MVLSWWFKKQNCKEENFLGRNAPDDTQRYFGKTVYLTMFNYLLIVVYLVFDFDFWGFISNISILEGVILQIVGFVGGCGFLVMMTMARLNLGESWREGLYYESTDPLVTEGFYKFVRNPYFTFLLGFQSALIFVIPNAVTIYSFLQSAILLGLQVRQEEIFLEQKYGETYRVYKESVGRFLPKFIEKILIHYSD